MNEFHWEIYLALNADLKEGKPPKEYQSHYLRIGKIQGRKYSIYELEPEFNSKTYKDNYQDLAELNEVQLQKHWIHIGKKENRSYKQLSKIMESIVIFVKKNPICIAPFEIYKKTLLTLLKNYENIKIISLDLFDTFRFDCDFIVLLNEGDYITYDYLETIINECKKTNTIVSNSFLSFYDNYEVYDVFPNNEVYDVFPSTNKFSGVCFPSNKMYLLDELEGYKTILIKHSDLLIYEGNKSNFLNNSNFICSYSKWGWMKNICAKIDIYKNKFAYITLLKSREIDKEYILRLQVKLKELLKYTFDIFDIQEISEQGFTKYEKIVIDGCILNSYATKISTNKVMSVLHFLKDIDCDKYILFHDLHYWSFSSLTIDPKKNVPILNETIEKKNLKSFLEITGIKYIISIYDCPEFDYLKKFLSNNYSFFVLHHYISGEIYQLPMSKEIKKDIDILFYGVDNSLYYPFRCKLLNICKKYFNVHHIPRKYRYDSNICDEGLAKYIQRSWISIACTSNYSYAVRKYNEISLCGSLVLGDSNRQINSMLGNYMIHITPKQSEEEIKNIIEFYLNNKIWLIYFGFKVREKLISFNDIQYIKRFHEILIGKYVDYLENTSKPMNYKYKMYYIEFTCYMLLEKGDYVLEEDFQSTHSNHNDLNRLEEDFQSTHSNHNDLNRLEEDFQSTHNIKYKKIIINERNYIYFKIEENIKVKIQNNIKSTIILHKFL